LNHSAQKIGWGHVEMVIDDDILSNVLEIRGDMHKNYITCPCDPNELLAISLPIFTIIIKNMRFFYQFEVQVLDDKNIKRTYQLTNTIVSYI